MTPEQLYRLGYSLILLKKEAKQPVDGKWSQGPRVALSDILDGIDEGYNIGFRPGITSKTKDSMFLHGIDLDIRVDDAREEAIAELESIFGRKFLKQCGRVISGSGGHSRHFHFVMSRPMRAKTVAHSKKKFFDEAKGKMRWEWEIEIFGEGKQMVLPPSIHPDTKEPYKWLQTPDDLPELSTDRLDEILDGLTRTAEGLDDEYLAPLGLKLREARNILSNLDFETWFVEREGWRNTGMALHHEFNGSDEAYRLWSEFSKKSDNFDPAEQRYQWGTFGRNDRVRPFRMASLMKEAAEAEIRDVMQPSEDDAEELREARRERKPTEKKKDASAVSKLAQPRHLLTIPGVLGDVIRIYNESAQREQPQFAVQSALALGSVVLSRNWVSDRNNYTLLYMLVLGETASGKEHAMSVVGKLLEQAEADIVGPSRYTSDAGIMTALEMRPVHISLADEFSRYLSAARGSGDANRSDAQSALMEIWGRADGIYLNKGYSGRALSKDQKEELKHSRIMRPGLTLLGASTPEKFFGAMGSEDVADGFLNRFLVVETELERQPMREDIKKVKITDSLLKWINYYRNHSNSDDDGDFTENSAAAPDDATVVPFSKQAKKLLRKIDAYCLARMKELDKHGMSGLYGRTREIIMRISLIVALSCDSEEIELSHVEWARDYVFYHTSKMEERATTTMGMSETQQNVEKCMAVIERMSADPEKLGSSVRELIQYCWSFKNMDTRMRDEIVRLMQSDHGVVIRNVTRANTGGKRGHSVKVLTLRDDL